jgi:dTDP-4-dehydrorhamnose reductase
MRILLTGVSGQVGSALREPLFSIGSVLAADRSVLDLSRTNSLFPALNKLSPDLIINPAAYTAVDQAEEERNLAYCVNVEAPRALARWAASHGVPIVHFSTNYVFDGSGDRPWREDDPTEPLSVYGASKLSGEAAIRETGGSHLIIRTSWVFAATGKNFLTTIAKLARERQELRIIADQIGAPTSARSIAQAVISIINTQGANEGGSGVNLIKRRFAEVDGLVHMSDKGETSWHGFATAIVDGLRSRGQQLSVGNIAAICTKDFPTKAKRPLNSRLDMTRLEKVYGIQMPPWQDALSHELDELAPGTDPPVARSGAS